MTMPDKAEAQVIDASEAKATLEAICRAKDDDPVAVRQLLTSMSVLFFLRCKDSISQAAGFADEVCELVALNTDEKGD
jgi:hypothetical protein